MDSNCCLVVFLVPLLSKEGVFDAETSTKDHPANQSTHSVDARCVSQQSHE